MSKTNSTPAKPLEFEGFKLVIGGLGWALAFILLAGMVSAQSPAPSYFIGCMTTTPYPLNPIFETATGVAKTHTAEASQGSPSPAPSLTTIPIMTTPLPFSTPTEDTLTTMPSAIPGQFYRVVAIQGVNVRLTAGTAAAIVGRISYGEDVWITNPSAGLIDGWRWGYVNRPGGMGWVALYNAQVTLLQAK